MAIPVFGRDKYPMVEQKCSDQLICHFYYIKSCSNDILSCSNDIISHSNKLKGCSDDILSRFDNLIGRSHDMISLGKVFPRVFK